MTQQSAQIIIYIYKISNESYELIVLTNLISG